MTQVSSSGCNLQHSTGEFRGNIGTSCFLTQATATPSPAALQSIHTNSAHLCLLYLVLAQVRTCTLCGAAAVRSHQAARTPQMAGTARYVQRTLPPHIASTHKEIKNSR